MKFHHKCTKYDISTYNTGLHFYLSKNRSHVSMRPNVLLWNIEQHYFKFIINILIFRKLIRKHIANFQLANPFTPTLNIKNIKKYNHEFLV